MLLISLSVVIRGSYSTVDTGRAVSGLVVGGGLVPLLSVTVVL